MIRTLLLPLLTATACDKYKGILECDIGPGPRPFDWFAPEPFGGLAMRHRSRFADLIAALRQEPGTARVRGAASLVDRAIARQAELADSTIDQLFELSQVLRSADWRSDAALVEYLGIGSELVRRGTGVRIYRVQLLATLSMLRGLVVDMATGEGKTFVGVLVSLGYALQGRRVHVLTANDYLAARDADIAGSILRLLGLEVSAVTRSTSVESRKLGYRANVVYTTIQQVGFDELYDRQATSRGARRLGARDVVIIDEIDAVLIDDAAVPLVLAGSAPDEVLACNIQASLARLAAGDDYIVDAECRNVALTDLGVARLERLLGVANLFAPEHLDVLAAVNVALHAEALLKRDEHYVVSDGAIRIVSEVRGRVDDRQRWPDGLQRAVELKEGLAQSSSAQVLDQVLVATVVGSYRTLTGMSGTAFEAALRLEEDHDLRVAVVPPNRPLRRVDEPDLLRATISERDEAAIERIRHAHACLQPVLVGTQSVAESERIARALHVNGIEASVLNARNDHEEAAIIARAGFAGAVTVSTQMAGRGVDIALDEAARAAGGLLVVGVSRHLSIRIDAQLRGRAGRQGDPGRSVFYTSLDDELVRKNLEPFELADIDADRRKPAAAAKHRRLYEHAQKVAESRMLQLHRKTRSYSRVLEQQRAIVLRSREDILSDDRALWDYLGRLGAENREFDVADVRRTTDTALLKEMVLFHFDDEWKSYLAEMADVRDGIHLRALGRQNPLIEFQLIAGGVFQNFFRRIDRAVISTLCMITSIGPSHATLRERLQRPANTWTYMVEENPFGTPEERFIQYLRKVVRGERRTA